MSVPLIRNVQDLSLVFRRQSIIPLSGLSLIPILNCAGCSSSSTSTDEKKDLEVIKKNIADETDDVEPDEVSKAYRAFRKACGNTKKQEAALISILENCTDSARARRFLSDAVGNNTWRKMINNRIEELDD